MLSRGKLMVKKALDAVHENTPENPIPGTSRRVTQQLVNYNLSDSDDQDFSAGSSDEYLPENGEYDGSFSDTSIDKNEEALDNNPNNSTENRDIATVDEEPEESLEDQENTKKLSNKTSRRRKRNPELWKKKLASTSREKGEEYTSQRGILMPAKAVQLNLLCTEKCRLKCNDKIDLLARENLLKEFYKMDINTKNAYLFRSIIKSPVQRVKTNATKQRSASFKYFVVKDGNQTNVCKLAFCQIFQIGRKKIQLIQKTLLAGLPAPKADMRGKHTNRPHKIKEEVFQYIINHIKLFPAESSHYSRNNNHNRKYLSPLLNVNRMYKLYIEKCKEDGKPEQFQVKEPSYRKIFVTEFNLAFGEPKSDTCSRCDSGESNDTHVKSYKAAFELQRKDRNTALTNAQFCYMTMDLQQTMPLPKISTSKAFYLRQLWLYNFGVHTVTTNGHQPFMFTWTEDIAGRGSNEIASSLLYFTQLGKDTLKNVNHLTIWSDSCSGRNKNFNIICLYQFLIRTGKFELIDHKYPEIGHSYLDSDRDFGRIEKRLRKHQKIFTPEQYRNIIKDASKNNGIVCDMEHHFQNIEDLATQLNLINRKKNIDNEKVHFRDNIKWIRVQDFGSYLYKESYDENEPFQRVNLLKNKSSTNPNLTLQRIDKKTGNISEEKLDNLRVQLAFVDEEYKWFYQQFLEIKDINSEPPTQKKKRQTKAKPKATKTAVQKKEQVK